MRAVTFAQFGGPEVLEISDVDVPEPAAGQIRIAVRAAGVNPVDWKFRRGLMGGDLPRSVGLEAAGVVAAVGDGVTDVSVGDSVFGFTVGGGAADQTLSDAYAPLPTGLDFVHAAGLPVAVETAYRTLDFIGAGNGQVIVINGAAGAVGQAAVQIAVTRGARVIGTASEANHQFLTDLGAEPILYGEGLADRIRALAGGPEATVDGAIDAAGGGALGDLIAVTGGPEHVVTIADFEGAQQHGVTFSGGQGDDRALYGLAAVTKLIEQGRFALPVAETFGLEDVARAQELSETGHVRGKIILVL